MSHGGVFGGIKSGVGYLRVWEGHCQWFVLGEFDIVMIQKKFKCNIGLFGIFFANFSIFPGEIVKSWHI
jgi:hypothetical protein